MSNPMPLGASVTMATCFKLVFALIIFLPVAVYSVYCTFSSWALAIIPY